MVADSGKFMPLSARCVPDLGASSSDSYPSSPTNANAKIQSGLTVSSRHESPETEVPDKDGSGGGSRMQSFDLHVGQPGESLSSKGRVLRRLLSSKDVERMMGSRKWINAWGGSFGFGLCIGLIALYFRLPYDSYQELFISAVTFVTMYMCTCFTTLAFIVPLWQEVREHVPMGMLASTFWLSGTLAVVISFTINSILMSIWSVVCPTCQPMYPHNVLDESFVSSFGCLLLVMVEWILTPGLIEEVSKCIALARLKSTPAAAESAVHNLTSSSSSTGGNPFIASFKSYFAVSWYRLALTPSAMCLAGLAAGGGFATVENFWFIFFRDPPEAWSAVQSGDPARALARLLPLHQLFSGIVGADLALWSWLPESDSRRPAYKWRGLLCVIPLHGIFDGCTFTAGYINKHLFDYGTSGSTYLQNLLYILQAGKFAIVFVTIWLFFRRWTQVCTWFDVSPRPQPISVV